MKEELKLTIKTDKDSVLDYFSELPEELKYRILELFTFDEILGAVENQLKGNTDLWGWSSSGWRDSSKLREEIVKIQGLEPEFKKDLESKINSLESDVRHYKKFYDWYFEVYRNKEVYEAIKRTVGFLN